MQQLEVTGPLLGVFDEPQYSAKTIKLSPGDSLILYTDGVIDAMNFDQIDFSLSRLLESIQKYADQPAQLMADNILWDVRRFIGLATQSDDISLVVVKYNPDKDASVGSG